VFGQGRLQQAVELAWVARRFTGQVERGEQFVAHRAGRGPSSEGDLADVLVLEFAQADVDGEGLAEAGAAVDAHHGPRGDRVADVLPGGEQGAGGDHGRIGQVDVLVGGRGHEASPSSSVMGGAARPPGPSGAQAPSRPDGCGTGQRGQGSRGAPVGRGRGGRDEVRHRELREVGVGALGEFGLGLRGGQRAEPLGGRRAGSRRRSARAGRHPGPFSDGGSERPAPAVRR